MTPSRLFAIAFVGRSGSSFLQGLIDHHPEAQCLGEIVSQLQVTDTSSMLRDLLDRTVHAAPTRVSGFKYGNANITHGPDISGIFREFGYGAVYLTRENRLDQYISMKLAMDNNSWRSDAGAFTKTSFVADAEHMEKFFGLFESHDVMVADAIAGLPTFKTTYERIVQPRGYYPVLDFLELERRDLVSVFERQRNGSQRDAMINYDEMRERFSGTWIGAHFTE